MLPSSSTPPTRAVRAKGSPEAYHRYLKAAREAREAAEMFPPSHHRRNLLGWAEAYARLAARGGVGDGRLDPPVRR